MTLNQEIAFQDFPQFETFIKDSICLEVENLGKGGFEKLGKTTSVPAVTLRRYSKSGPEPYSKHAKPLLRHFSKDKKHFKQMLVHYFPEEYQIYSEIYEDGDINVLPAKISHLYNLDKRYFYIHTLSGLKPGLKLNLVSKMYGSDGEDKADELVSKEAIALNEDNIYETKHSEYSHADINGVLKGAQILVEDFDLNNFKRKEGGIINFAGTTNKAGLKWCRDLNMEIANKIKDFRKNEEYKGTIPYHITVLSGRLNLPDYYINEAENNE